MKFFTKRRTNLFASVLLIAFFLLTAAKPNSPGWVADLHSQYSNKKEFIAYWKNSDAMNAYQCVYRVPQEVIISKMWNETQGGMAGAGTRGALFGIKGNGIKGYDNVDKEKVEYQYYGAAWESISHFCKLITNPRNMYYARYRAWMSYDHNLEVWEAMLLGMQVHPELDKSKLGYAACGCKDGRNRDCWKKRKAHAMKCIKWVKDNGVDK